MGEGVSFDSFLKFRCPSGAVNAVALAAAKKSQKPSEWLRQAVLVGLRAAGIDLTQERQFCRVLDGEIVSRATFKPDLDLPGEWVLVEDRDSEPFDPAKHWRLAPLPLRIETDRVVRTYPVVLKTIEHA